MRPRRNSRVLPKSTSQAWRIWDQDHDYGETLTKRAEGDLPEMESAKSLAKLLSTLIQPGDRVLDVGCGAGHYLRSLKREIEVPFTYTGADATANYIELARDAWSSDPHAGFELADIFELPFDDGEFDIVMCCNVFLHLPSIRIPLRNLARVAKRELLIRTLVGDRSFRIQEVYSAATHPRTFPFPLDQHEFDENGEPLSFHYYNIYARSWLETLIDQLPGVKSYSIVPDEEFEPSAIDREAQRENAPPDVTRMVAGWQVNGYILQPWHFIQITKDDPAPSGPDLK